MSTKGKIDNLRKLLSYWVVAPILAHLRATIRSRQLTYVQLQPALNTADRVLVCVIQNEVLRMPFFLQYYRAMGLQHFLLIDNQSSDGIVALLRDEKDVSIVHARGKFGSARYGFDWINYLARRHCRGKWLLCVDADEHLLLPNDCTSVGDVILRLKSSSRTSMQALLLDMYSHRPSSENDVSVGEDPLEVCPLYDHSGYEPVRDATTGVTWIKGGVRGRVFFADNLRAGPALNKTPLVSWSWAACFLKSTHELWPRKLNGRGDIGSLLLHFKFTRMSVERMVAKSYRAEHTSEYLQYDSSESEMLLHPTLTTDARIDPPSAKFTIKV